MDSTEWDEFLEFIGGGAKFDESQIFQLIDLWSEYSEDAFFELANCLTNHKLIKSIRQCDGVKEAFNNGVGSALDAFASGVPLDDIMA